MHKFTHAHAQNQQALHRLAKGYAFLVSIGCQKSSATQLRPSRAHACWQRQSTCAWPHDCLLRIWKRSKWIPLCFCLLFLDFWIFANGHLRTSNSVGVWLRCLCAVIATRRCSRQCCDKACMLFLHGSLFCMQKFMLNHKLTQVKYSHLSIFPINA